MRLLRPFLLPLSLLVLLTAAVRVPMPVFVERPGAVRSLADSVVVPDGGPLDGDFLLTTVNLRRGTVVDVVASLFDPASDLIATEALVPPGESSDEYFDSQRSLFAVTADVAAAVGLDEAGYDVSGSDVTGEGALVVAILDGAPAEGVLRPGDVVVAVDGEPVATSDDLQTAVVAVGEESLEVTVRRDGQRRTTALTPQRSADTGGPVIGVQVETVDPRIDLPVPVEVDSGRIGGPSAGLLIALTVYDKAATDVDLVAGRRVAGTGALAPDGTVGPIGSIEQKVVTAHRADADVFLVPAPQHALAAAALPAGSELEVVAVGTFSDAVEALAGADPA